MPSWRDSQFHSTTLQVSQENSDILQEESALDGNPAVLILALPFASYRTVFLSVKWG
jgi:hypothetical protein